MLKMCSTWVIDSQLRLALDTRRGFHWDKWNVSMKTVRRHCFTVHSYLSKIVEGYGG